MIFEKFYGGIPKGCHVHHKDGNKTNNCILNLQIIPISEHNKLHHKNKTWSEQALLNLNKARNKTGFFRVSKFMDSKCSQGFTWVYRWRENGKPHSISSMDLDTLKEKVLARGLKWFEI